MKYNIFEARFSAYTPVNDGTLKREYLKHKVLVAANSFGDVEMLLEIYCKNMNYGYHIIRIIKRVSCCIDIENDPGDVWKLTSRLISNNRCLQKFDFYIKSSNIEEHKLKIEEKYDENTCQTCSVEKTEYEDILCRGYGVLKDVIDVPDVVDNEDIPY